MSTRDGQIMYHEKLSYEEFQSNVRTANVPLLIGPDLTRGWSCMEQWRAPQDHGMKDSALVTPSESGSIRPNFQALRKYGHHNVSVTDTSKRVPHIGFDTEERLLSDLLDLWESDIEDGKGLYVKDWHLALEIEREGGRQDEVYVTPDIFRDDWLTPYYLSLPASHPTTIPPALGSGSPPFDDPHPIPSLGQTRSDYRFVYLGPAGTFTPLHCDVYKSWSWSTNVVGRKRWWFVPPSSGSTKSDGEDRRFEGVFDLRDLSTEALHGVWILDQEPGQTIFVPSGWYHQVLNLDFCISINHNFLSSLNLPVVYAALLDSQAKVEESIRDVEEMIRDRVGESLAHKREIDLAEPRDESVSEPVRSWEVEWMEQVQSLLEMDAGWGLRVFWRMVLHNLESPPAPAHLRPPREDVFARVRPILEEFKRRREYLVFQDLRRIITRIDEVVAQSREADLESGSRS